LKCEKCPIAEECGLSDEGKKMCPLVALIKEWRVRTLRKTMKHAAPGETSKVQDEIYKRICFIHEVRGSHKTVSELLREFSGRRLLKDKSLMKYNLIKIAN